MSRRVPARAASPAALVLLAGLPLAGRAAAEGRRPIGQEMLEQFHGHRETAPVLRVTVGGGGRTAAVTITKIKGRRVRLTAERAGPGASGQAAASAPGSLR